VGFVRIDTDVPPLHRFELEMELTLGFQIARVLSWSKQHSESMPKRIQSRHCAFAPLLRSQRIDRVDARCSARRDPTGEERHHKQQYRNSNERECVARRDAVEHTG